MDALLGFLVLLVPLWLVVGLIKPSWALRWGQKRTRLRVFGWFLFFALVVCVLIVISVPTPKQTASPG